MKEDTLNQILEELEKVRTKGGGTLKPEDVVEFARDKSTALHERFCWDDTEAARRWRLHQAAEIIRVQVQIIDKTNKDPVRVYVSLTTDRETGKGYRKITDVISDKQLAEVMLKDALAELIAFKRKYGVLSRLVEGSRILKKIDEVINLFNGHEKKADDKGSDQESAQV